MKVWILGSGSSGNAVLIEADGTRVLVDAGFGPRAPAATARLALFRVFSDAVPFFGGGSFTPARRALDRPIAIACFADRAPCLPSRMWCISSRMNSPA